MKKFRGQALIEYGLLIAAVVVLVAAFVVLLGDALGTILSNVVAAVEGVTV